jgi:nucleotide-binding universal stress UspA family protein
MAALLPRRIVAGVDASAVATTALDHAVALAEAFAAHLVVVHARGLLESADAAAAFDPEAALAAAMARTGAQPAASAAVEPGHPAEALLRAAEREGADLVIVGSRGSGGTRRLLGSTSEAVLAGANRPVLVIPALS